MTNAQRRMWFINRFDPSVGSYNIPFGLRVGGVLDVGALELAFGDVVGRHERCCGRCSRRLMGCRSSWWCRWSRRWVGWILVWWMGLRVGVGG